MLTQEQIEALAAPLQWLYISMEHEIVRVICKRVEEIGEMTPGDTYKLDRLGIYGSDMENIKKIIADYSGQTDEYIEEAYKKASEKEYSDLNEIPFEENDPLQTLLAQICISSTTLIKSAVAGIMMKDLRTNKTKPIDEVYKDVINSAILQIQTGTKDFHKAMSQAIRYMADTGVVTRYFSESGRSMRMDAYVRMTFMDMQSQMSMQQAELTGKQFGADGMEITWHSGYRPSHNFGGKQFTMEEYRSRIELELNDYNCYHRAFPIVLGVSTPAYTDEQLKQMDADEITTKMYQGKTYNKYDATQEQRKYERAIRRQKDRMNAFESAGDTKSYNEAKAKLQTLRKNYREFSKAMGMKVKYNRTRSYNLGGSQNTAPTDTNNNEWYNSIIGIQTPNGITITDISIHAVERAIERKVSIEDVQKALQEPLIIKDIKNDKNGRSQQFLGEKAVVVVNPDTGNIITLMPMGSKRLKSIKNKLETD